MTEILGYNVTLYEAEIELGSHKGELRWEARCTKGDDEIYIIPCDAVERYTLYSKDTFLRFVKVSLESREARLKEQKKKAITAAIVPKAQETAPAATSTPNYNDISPYF